MFQSKSRTEEEIELDRAVLHELTSSLNGSMEIPTFDLQHLLCKSEYQMDAEKNIRGFEDEDDDWQAVKKSRDDPDFHSGPFVRLFDKTRKTMYHVDTRRPRETRPAAESQYDDTTAPIDLSTGGTQQRVAKQSDVKEVLDRLILENGHCAPKGYQEWISKKLRARMPLESDIPGYATLCERCHQMLTSSTYLYKKTLQTIRTMRLHATELRYEVFNHHKTIEALRASASAGCHLCSLINALHPAIKSPETCNEGPEITYFLRIQNHFKLGLFACDLPAKSTLCLRTRRRIEQPSTLRFPSTKAPEILQLAQKWLTRCLQEDREICFMPTNFVPSRLVKVTAIDGRLECARLVLREELPIETQYLTLSHCWGSLNVLRLEKATLGNFRTDIPLRRLSKTFEEALQMTIWLGYQYIWIDSLCIQQDSDTDWAKEAAVMGAIYRYSTCTIAASGARDGDGGLFSKRSALAFTDCPLFRFNDFQVHASCLEPWPTPLSTRAWAVQEKHLSPRVLSFGSDKISWSCRRTEACEGPRAHELKLRFNSFSRLLDHCIDAESAERAWGEVVRQYTRCDLTFWRDKWPAFQGLAAEVTKAQNWRLVHGLRYDVLGLELLWYLPQPCLGTIELGKPSWSWLNVKGGIHLNSDIDGSRLQAGVSLQEPPAQADTGEATDTPNDILQIEAHMIDFKASSTEDTTWAQRCTLAITNPLFMPEQTDWLLDCDWYPDTIQVSNGKIWALQISEHRSEYEGLVITTVEEKPGYWRRVGRYTCRWSRGNDATNPPSPWNHMKSTVYVI